MCFGAVQQNHIESLQEMDTRFGSFEIRFEKGLGKEEYIVYANVLDRDDENIAWGVKSARMDKIYKTLNKESAYNYYHGLCDAELTSYAKQDKNMAIPSNLEKVSHEKHI